MKVKLIGVFLVAFVCLNAGGAVCVAYCRTAVEAVVTSQDHCPLKKKTEHCDPGKGENSEPDAVGGGEIDCCQMTVSFIGAPIEKRTPSFEKAAVSASAETAPLFPILFRSPRQVPPSAYRGPPLDRRVERIKHKIIRI